MKTDPLARSTILLLQAPLIGAAALTFGCNGTSELTCDVLADPSNCWNEAASAAYACIPAEVGVLATDRLSCDFSDGTTITFDEAVPQDNDDVRNLDTLAFTIRQAGSECARFVDTLNNRLELTAGSASAVGELLAGSEFVLSCGDGSSFSTDFSTLFACEASGVTAPTDNFIIRPTFIEFGIRSDVTSGNLFRCETN